MAEYSGVTQNVAPGESIIFSIVNVPSVNGNINHDASTGNFLLRGNLQNAPSRGCCRRPRNSLYTVAFGANIGVADIEGAVVGPVSVAFAVDGGTLTNTTMTSTPAAVGDVNNVGRVTNVPIFGNCCQTVTVRNTSAVTITVENPNLVFID